jgi:hypothetical protein
MNGPVDRTGTADGPGGRDEGQPADVAPISAGDVPLVRGSRIRTERFLSGNRRRGAKVEEGGVRRAAWAASGRRRRAWDEACE